eukprot:IDg23771t1
MRAAEICVLSYGMHNFFDIFFTVFPKSVCSIRAKVFKFEHRRLIVPFAESLLSELELEGKNSLSESFSLGSDDEDSSLGSSAPMFALME